MALHLAQRGAHRGRHRRQAGLAAGFGVHRVHLGHHALPLRRVILGWRVSSDTRKPQQQPR